MSGSLSGKTAFVTGAGSGIGRSAARAMAREGARVFCTDLASADETADEIRGKGGDAVAATVDVTDEAQIAAAIAALLGRWGQLDCAFNNAGIGAVTAGCSGTRVSEIPLASWNMLISVNLTGVFLCMKHELIAMERAGGGAIVNTASIAGLVGMPTSGGYVASKHAVVGLTKAAALDYAGAGIRVNAICPGYIDTPMAAGVQQSHGPQIMANVPAGRWGSADEIAEAAVWLCSDRSSYVTGATLSADGGFTAR